MIKLLGHETEKLLIKKLLNREYDSLSLLYEGIDCIGKKLTALYTARAYLCERREDFGCGVCKDCRLVNNVISNVYEGTNLTPHYDLMLIQSDSSEIKIDQIRAVIEFLRTKGEKGKVVIIEKTENMNLESSNALLKTLEEPPEKSLIILTTSNQSRILPTILSRVKKIKFKKLSEEVVQQILVHRGIDSEKAKKIAEISDGSLCLPLYILENEVIYSYGKDFYSLLKNPEHLEGLFSLTERLDNLQSEQLLKLFDIIYILFSKDMVDGHVKPELFEKFVYEYKTLIKAINKGVKRKTAILGFYFKLMEEVKR